MSKNSYSTFSYGVLERIGISKHDIKTKPLSYLRKLAYSMPDNLLSELPDHLQSKNRLVIFIVAAKKYVEGDDVIHIFIESKNLYSFLQSQNLKSLDIDYNVLKQIGTVGKPSISVEIDGKKNKDIEGTSKIFIHHKNKNLPSFYVLVSKTSTSTGIAGSVSVLSERFAYETRSRETNLDIPKEIKSALDGAIGEFYGQKVLNNIEDINRRPIVKFVYNLFFYLEAFPDSLLNSTPEEIKMYKKFYKSDSSIKVGAHDMVLDKDGVSPHFRSGHFRRLKSDRFKNKKGQVVFVRSTMVKGKAKTVNEVQDKEKVFNA